MASIKGNACCSRSVIVERIVLEVVEHRSRCPILGRHHIAFIIGLGVEAATEHVREAAAKLSEIKERAPTPLSPSASPIPANRLCEVRFDGAAVEDQVDRTAKQASPIVCARRK
jgi:hypothetical protein